MTNGSYATVSSPTEVGTVGLNANVIVWAIVNGTTRVNQPTNSFIVSHQEPSDGTAKKVNLQQISLISELKENNDTLY